ncbi:MAG: DUF3343 domain-containing protein [Armatimonadetes bacterium]|nr:DUF3343 domain-containing protein [Armatimonadota bacterium]
MPERRIVLLFPTTHAVMHAAQILERAAIPHDIVPRPKGVDADCGIALSLEPGAREQALGELGAASREPSRVLEHERP